MRFLQTALFAFAVAFSPSSLPAQSAKPASNIQSRLDQALKFFPDADANKDGTLSMDEAFKYVEAHPELKALIGTKLDAAGSGRSSSKGAAFAPGAEGTRVFVCAHSYMIYTADILPRIAQAAGVAHLSAGRQMIGGSRVLQHWNLPDEKNQAKKALSEGIVDVLTVSPHLLLPDEGIDNYTKLGLEKNPKLRVLVQASWAPRDGVATGDFRNTMRDSVTPEQVRQMRDAHHAGWLKSLEAQARTLNQSVGHETVFIVPVSAAVYGLRERIAEGKAPGLTKQSEMFRDDHGHPSEVTAMLVSYCHFAAIYQRSPVGLPVPPEWKDRPQAAELNKLLQEIAWNTVSTYPMSGVKSRVAAAK